MALRASEPLGGGLRASGSIGEVGGLALMFAAFVLGVFYVLVCVWLLLRLLVWLAVRAGRLLAWLLWAGPRASDLHGVASKQKF
jgi:hypothetical protein